MYMYDKIDLLFTKSTFKFFKNQKPEWEYA